MQAGYCQGHCGNASGNDVGRREERVATVAEPNHFSADSVLLISKSKRAEGGIL